MNKALRPCGTGRTVDRRCTHRLASADATALPSTTSPLRRDRRWRRRRIRARRGFAASARRARKPARAAAWRPTSRPSPARARTGRTPGGPRATAVPRARTTSRAARRSPVPRRRRPRRTRLPVVDGARRERVGDRGDQLVVVLRARRSSGEARVVEPLRVVERTRDAATRRHATRRRRPVITDRVEAIEPRAARAAPCRAAATVDDPRRARGRPSGCSPRSRSCSSRRTARDRWTPAPTARASAQSRVAMPEPGSGYESSAGGFPTPPGRTRRRTRRWECRVERRSHVPRPATRRSRRTRRRASG